MRSFIALELGSHVKETLADLIDSLRRQGGNIRWSKPSNLHLTLKFLGEVPDEQIPKIKDGLQRVAGLQPAFAFHIRGTGTFPTGGRQRRVIWVGIEAQPALKLLYQELENELFKLGFPGEKRPFSPHLTIGRIKSSDGLSPTLHELERHTAADFGTVQANKLILFKSTLMPTGAEYSSLFEAGLS